jgi:hypothetical protein
MPLCLSAEPHTTGVICIATVARRRAFMTISGGMSRSSTNRSSSCSSFSAAASSILCRHSLASARFSAGMSFSSACCISSSSWNSK